jgi:DNA-binding transcriptional MerR regulator
MSKASRTYSISELAEEFSVTARALRFYEDKGLLAPRREGLTRLYGARDRARLTLILRGKRMGFPLNEIKEALDLYDAASGNRAQLKLVHEKFAVRLTALRQQRIDLDKTIEELEQDIAALDQRLAQPAAPAKAQAPAKAAGAFGDVAQRRLEETR